MTAEEYGETAPVQKHSMAPAAKAYGRCLHVLVVFVFIVRDPERRVRESCITDVHTSCDLRATPSDHTHEDFVSPAFALVRAC